MFIKNSGNYYIYLVRHGHREDSVNKGFLYSLSYPLDSDLSKLGVIQVKELAQEMMHYKIDAIYSSPYLRTIHTAYWCAYRSEQLIRVESSLSEFYYYKSADYPKIRSLDQFEQSFPDLSRRLLVKDEQDFRLPTYNETEEDAKRRSTNWLRKYFKSQRALVITHESICNFLIRQLTGASKWSYTPLGFGSISVLESKNKQQWKLVKLNDTSFLSSGEICR